MANEAHRAVNLPSISSFKDDSINSSYCENVSYSDKETFVRTDSERSGILVIEGEDGVNTEILLLLMACFFTRTIEHEKVAMLQMSDGFIEMRKGSSFTKLVNRQIFSCAFFFKSTE